jgi:hypothetical protein
VPYDMLREKGPNMGGTRGECRGDARGARQCENWAGEARKGEMTREKVKSRKIGRGDAGKGGMT